MVITDAIYESRFSQAGLYDTDGLLVLACGYPGGHVEYLKPAKRISKQFGGEITQWKNISPSTQLLMSNDWQPISPL